MVEGLWFMGFRENILSDIPLEHPRGIVLGWRV